MNISSDFHHIVILIDAISSTTFGTLHRNKVHPQSLRTVGEIGNLSIGMQSEYIRGVDDGDIPDMSEEPLVVHLTRHRIVVFIGLREEEFFVLVEQEIAHVLIEIGGQHPTI